MVLMTSNDAFTETIPDSNIEDIVSEVLDEIIDRIVVEDKNVCVDNDTQCKEPDSVSKTTHDVSKTTHKWSLFECIMGQPSKCGMFAPAEITTMEKKYCVYPSIAEFWCFVTSIFYGSSLLLYFVKEDDWFEKWREDTKLPGFIQLSMISTGILVLGSMVYHSTLFEITGCVDCCLASFVFVSVIMSTFGIGVLFQACVLLFLIVLNVVLWRYSTRIALIIYLTTVPFGIISCYRMDWFYAKIIAVTLLCGFLCFALDRNGYLPLHSLWHIFSSFAIFFSLYHVIINGPV